MAAIVAQEEQPISRTYQYRKVMKPMLERKRRARINRCLDELKELLVGALQAEGESVSRLEKADVLELTVRHLHKLRRVQQMNETSAGERFRAGFVHCANEVSTYMSVSPNPVDPVITSRLMTHLDNCIHRIDSPTAASLTPNSMTSPGSGSAPGLNILTNYTPPSSPVGSPLGHVYPYSVMNMKQEVQIQNSPSPAHLQSQSPFGGSVIPKGHGHGHESVYHPQGYAPMALMCRKSPVESERSPMSSMEEPFDLSNNVWRPW